MQLVCVFAQALSLPVVAIICLSTCGPLLLLFGTTLCVDFHTGACHIVETMISSFGFYSLLRVPTYSNYSVCSSSFHVHKQGADWMLCIAIPFQMVNPSSVPCKHVAYAPRSVLSEELPSLCLGTEFCWCRLRFNDV